MTITLGRIAGADYVDANKRVKIRTLTFSSTYATGGETITAASLGLKRVYQVLGGGIATSTDLATANPVAYTINTAGTSVTVLQYEGSAAGTAISEKTNSEAYATGSNCRTTFIGY